MNNKNKILKIAGIAILLLLPLFIKSGYILQSFIMVLLYAYWASCWNIISGYAGSISMGHATYIGIGAYVTTVLLRTYGLTPWAGMIVAGLVAGLVSLMIGYPCFKLKGSYFTLSTVALLHVLRLIVTSNDTLFGFKINGAQGLDIPWVDGGFMKMQFLDKRYYLYIIIAFLAIIVFVSSKISKSKMGYYLYAINTNQEAAASLGVDVTKYKLTAMFISAFFTAIGGAFYSQLILFVDPQRILGYDLSAEIMFFSVIGGMGTVWGPVIGAVLMVPINEITRSTFGASMSGLAMLIYGVIFMLVVYFMPQGVYIYIKQLKAKISKKKDLNKEAVGGVKNGKSDTRNS